MIKCFAVFSVVVVVLLCFSGFALCYGSLRFSTKRTRLRDWYYYIIARFFRQVIVV